MKKSFAVTLITMSALLPMWLSLSYAGDIYDKTNLASGGDYTKTIPTGTTGFSTVKDAYTQTAYSKDAYLYPAYSYTPKTYGSTENANTAWDLKMSYINSGTVAAQYTPATPNVSGTAKNTAIVNTVPSLAKTTTPPHAAPSARLDKAQKSTNIEKVPSHTLIGCAKKTATQTMLFIPAETGTNKNVKYNNGSPNDSFYGTFKELKTDKHANKRNKPDPGAHGKTLKKAEYQGRGYKAILDSAEPALEMTKMRIGTIKTNLAHKAEQLKNAVSGIIPIIKNSFIDSSEVIHASEELDIILPALAEPLRSAEPMESQGPDNRNRNNMQGKAKNGALVPAQPDTRVIAKRAAMVHLSILSIDKANNYHKTGLSPPDDSFTLKPSSNLSAIILPVLFHSQNINSDKLNSHNRIIQDQQRCTSLLFPVHEHKGFAFKLMDLYIYKRENDSKTCEHKKGGTNETS